jgi:hypothetical protein
MNNPGRKYLFVALSLCAGWGTQETVNRFSTADEASENLAPHVAAQLCSARAFYEAEFPQAARSTAPVVEQRGPVLSIVEALGEPIEPSFDSPYPRQQHSMETPGEANAPRPPQVARTVPASPAARHGIPPQQIVVTDDYENEPQREPARQPVSTNAVAMADPPTWLPLGQTQQAPPVNTVQDVHALPPPSAHTAREKEPVSPRADIRIIGPSDRYRSYQSAPPTVAHKSSRYIDPREAVRQRAALKAAERQRRIQARKWLGYSPLRPSASPIPFMSSGSTRPAIVRVR